MSEQPWYDAVDFQPSLVCEVELTNGETMLARHVMDEWETLDGEVITTVAKFRIYGTQILVGLYEWNP